MTGVSPDNFMIFSKSSILQRVSVPTTIFDTPVCRSLLAFEELLTPESTKTFKSPILQILESISRFGVPFIIPSKSATYNSSNPNIRFNSAATSVGSSVLKSSDLRGRYFSR